MIGVIGGFIPVLQGWIFVLMGFILLDFDKKYYYEEKFLKLISKTRVGKKLSIFWIKIKHKNKNVIETSDKRRIGVIYYNIQKDVSIKKKRKNG